ncbi:MAG: amidohydrolase family protein, partial [Hyphomicrobiaceae bacterium]
DLGLLLDSGTSVAHCPTVFVRRGIALETFGGYLRRGLTVGIGTDTFPHNMLEEVRSALYTARVVAGTQEDVSTAQGFHAATLGGAKLLGRTDIGRLAVGAKADVVLVDCRHPAMRPLRDPLRSLIYTAAERAVRDVFIDGRQVVENGRLKHVDVAASSEGLEAAQRRAEAGVEELDWAGRAHDELSPMTLPRRGRNA